MTTPPRNPFQEEAPRLHRPVPPPPEPVTAEAMAAGTAPLLAVAQPRPLPHQHDRKLDLYGMRMRRQAKKSEAVDILLLHACIRCAVLDALKSLLLLAGLALLVYGGLHIPELLEAMEAWIQAR